MHLARFSPALGWVAGREAGSARPAFGLPCTGFRGVCCGVISCRAVRCGAVRCGVHCVVCVVLCAVLRYSVWRAVVCDMQCVEWSGVEWCRVVWCNLVRSSVMRWVQCSEVWCGVVQCGAVHLSTSTTTPSIGGPSPPACPLPSEKLRVTVALQNRPPEVIPRYLNLNLNAPRPTTSCPALTVISPSHTRVSQGS